MDEHYFYGTGRRKTSVARVRLLPGKGAIVINGTPYEELFTRTEYRRAITKPLIVTDSINRFNVVVKVEGGGVTGQAAAISHGIARALVQANVENKVKLRQGGFLTRDPRAKERKKAGLRRARKAPQYTKR
ncbi:MAG: 30S ribosomal protein S9 [Chloroflexi bacterium RBG_13_46_9]|nr:MAG: 30S ribosomal protein S9 [Chloroflexi bacterium RBG_13_46_9]